MIFLRDFPLGGLDKSWSLSLPALAQLPMENGEKRPDSLSHSEKSVVIWPVRTDRGSFRLAFVTVLPGPKSKVSTLWLLWTVS